VSDTAAFFDLDRTLLRRSSALALAGSFRDRGLISRRQLAKAALFQLLFVARGANAEAVQHIAEDGLRVLKSFTPEEMRELVAAALEPVLKPLVYREPLALAREHRRRGECVYIVSAALEEIVEALADELGFDGALGTVCERCRTASTPDARCGRSTTRRKLGRCESSHGRRASTSLCARPIRTAAPTFRFWKRWATRSR
jgi:phosphoserine phosphatase